MKGMALHRLTSSLIGTLALLLLAAPVFVLRQQAMAAFLDNRSVTIASPAPQATTTHQFQFNIATAGTLGSIELEYCANGPLIGTPCTAPVGLSLSDASLSAQTGETGFSISSSSTDNKFILTRLAVPAVPQTASYEFSGAVNPSATNQSVYVRISTFASEDATGPRIDTGAVVFSTSSGLGTLLYVPPHLTFCVGITVSADCANAQGNGMQLGELSATAPRVATSQFAGATNDFNGYSVAIFGTTMTSGNNSIPAVGAPAASRPGSSQFGINLRANSDPAVGQNRTGIGTATVGSAYSTPNRFMFLSGSRLVSSSLATNFNTFTVSYLVNINADQPPGIYSTTATFLATASF